MSGDTSITVIGNLTIDPELRFTPVSRGFRITDWRFESNPGADVA